MKKTAIVSAVLCLSLMAAGCTHNGPNPSSEPTATSATAAPTETTETSEETTVEPANATHQVTVEIVTLQSSKDGEYNQVVPNVIVDGKEAMDINNVLSSYIQKEYPLDIFDDHAEGMATRLYWGVKDNVLSIVIFASETFTDYYTYDVFNYDIDTLKGIDNSEAVKSLGMTEEEFFSKTSEIVNSYCTDYGYDLEKSLQAVNFDKCKPFVMPDGTVGVAASIAYPADSQFGGGDSTRCFNLATKEPAVFEQ